jgi:thiosulfate/3-mercaptopyruvate sulfurtransferase
MQGLFLFLMLLAPADGQKLAGYPRAELLIEASELAKPEIAKQFHLLDVRSPEKYEAGHIPGAVRVNTSNWSKAFASTPDPELWGKHLAQVLLRDTNTRVVVYGDDVRDTARVWWILRYWGVKDVRLLNGGWQAWETAKGPVVKGPGVAAAGPGLQLTPSRNASPPRSSCSKW